MSNEVQQLHYNGYGNIVYKMLAFRIEFSVIVQGVAWLQLYVLYISLYRFMEAVHIHIYFLLLGISTSQN